MTAREMITTASEMLGQRCQPRSDLLLRSRAALAECGRHWIGDAFAYLCEMSSAPEEMCGMIATYLAGRALLTAGHSTGERLIREFRERVIRDKRRRF